MVTRRQLAFTLGAGAFAACFRAYAQQSPPKVFRIGTLSTGSRTPDGAPPGPFREGLRALGYVERQNIVYEARFAEGKWALSRPPQLIRLRRNSDAKAPSTLAAKQAT
jgi:hypothetical protein